MRLHHFIQKNLNLSEEKINLQDKEICNQIKNVLKLRVGEKIILCNGSGEEVVVKILNFDEGINCEVEERKKNSDADEVEINLFLSILKKDNFELVVQKAAELGVKKIIPIISSRTIKTNLNPDRLKKIAKEAAEQCERTDIPEIEEIIKFKDVVDLKKGELNILFDRNGIKSLPEKGKTGVPAEGRVSAVETSEKVEETRKK